MQSPISNEEIEAEVRRLIALHNLGALVASDEARKHRGDEGRSSFYAAIGRGEIIAKKMGGRTLITAESLMRSVVMAREARLVTGLLDKPEHLWTEEERRRVAELTGVAARMHARRGHKQGISEKPQPVRRGRGRPIGSRNKPQLTAQEAQASI